MGVTVTNQKYCYLLRKLSDLNRVHGSEHDLITACRNGDPQAQLALYKQYYKAMYNSAFRILKDQGLAEDVMQESFLSAFTNLERFRGEVTFGAWLKRIVINTSIYQYRKKQKRNEVVFETPHLQEDVENPFLSEENEVAQKAKTVLKLMEELPQNYHIILNLHLVEGYDYEEICEITGMSYANCRTTISRAKTQLREKLKSLGSYA